MPYSQAWPLIRSGSYSRPHPQGPIKAFSGSLAKKNGIKLTIEQIKEVTEKCWAGEFQDVERVLAERRS
jgi:hypothetical protein